MDFVQPARPFALELIAGRGHYERVVRAAMDEDHRAAPGRRRTARTAARASASAYRSILEVFDELAARGVELRILHATPPSRPFRATLARSLRLARALQLRACPRVHFKAVVVDGAFVYVGSANWTGAGLGAKGAGRRNFELGFAGADDGLLDRVQELYDRIWRGAACKGCKLREVCPAPLDGEARRPLTRSPHSK